MSAIEIVKPRMCWEQKVRMRVKRVMTRMMMKMKKKESEVVFAIALWF